MEDSKEATNQIVPLSDEAWLAGAYASQLNREPDDEGQAYWLEQLNAGLGRSQVATHSWPTRRRQRRGTGSAGG